MTNFPLLKTIKNIFKSFLLTSFLVYSIMYLVPGNTKFTTELSWPLSYFNWLIEFFTLRLNLANMGIKYLRTLFLVFGSLGLCFLIVVILLAIKHLWNRDVYAVLATMLNFTSGFHILVLSIILYLLKNISGFHFLIFLILAIGNGTLSEMLNTFDSELEHILDKEYAIAGKAWGYSRFSFAKNSIIISLVEMLIARIPIIFGNTIIIELIFNIKGVSYTIFFIIIGRDFEPLILSTVLISTTIIIFSTLSKQIRSFLDPRVKYAST